MPVRREQVAAALKYLGDKADVKRRYERMVSLDQPTDSDAVDTALEMGGSLVPGVGQALAARDFERARRAGDEAGMGMAAASALPLGRLAGALKQYDPVMQKLDVYHGSPHKFEEFDASKIGTGEGAQAYGHGIYLAESPSVAKSYSFKRMTGDINFNDGTKINVLNLPKGSPEKVAAQIWLTNPSLEESTNFVKNISKTNWKKDHPDWENPQQQVLDELKKLNKKGASIGGGNFYTADLPDEMVDRMLDYDKLLSEQQGLLKIAKKINDKYVRWGEPVETGTGKELYESLEAQVGTIKATEIMRKAGIPGIKYADAGSRGQGGTGTRNFVVFPGEEKKVKILKRE